MAKMWFVRMAYLLVAAFALSSGGCLALAIGAAAGGVAAGYALYERGQWYRDYPANQEDAAAAVKTALGELQLPIVNENRENDVIVIDSRTGDGEKIRVQLKALTNRIPADGPATHISIRVGPVMGDEALSTRILEQIGLHLEAPVQVRTVTAPPPASSMPPPHESAAPPLAK